jgi:hypothetical protein
VNRFTTLVAAASLALFAALVWSAAAEKSETIDEGLFLCGGVAQVRLSDPNLDLSHPPLLRWLAGVPAVLAGARLTRPAPLVPPGAMNLHDEKLQSTFDWAADLLYENDHDRVLRAGRLPFALLGVLVAWLLFVEVRRRFGDAAGLAALAAFAFTPEVLAHAEWAHSDLASALALLVVALVLARTLEAPSPANHALLGAALGLSLLVKLTGLLVLPLALTLVLIFGKRRALGVGMLVAVLYLVVVVGYLPRPRLWGPHELLAEDVARALGPARGLAPLLRWAPLPDTFLKGLVYTRLLGQHGQIAFFHGEVRGDGWWYYFPAALFLKYPTPLLILALIGVVALARSPSLSRERKLALTLPPLVLFAFAMLQHIAIGVRSVLSLAPFLALWSGVAVASVRTSKGTSRWAVAALLLLSVASGITAYPNFLTYFNPLMGGTAAADRWLVDSNLDWGQDLPSLARALERRHIGAVRLAYFGAGRPEHWRIQRLDPSQRGAGWFAISRTLLSGMWPPGDPYGWLRALRPVELVGGSIALFDVPGDDLMSAGLAALYQRHDAPLALSLFDQILAQNPTHYGAQFQRAMALEAAGRRAEALAAWRKFADAAAQIGDAPNGEIARAHIAALTSAP